MNVDVLGLDQARVAWNDGKRRLVTEATVSSLSIGASLEAACWRLSDPAALSAVVERWAKVSPICEQAVAILGTSRELPRPDHHAAPDFEVCRCPTRAALADPTGAGLEWEYYLDRFSRSLVSRVGVGKKKAQGLAGALTEMVDNVVDHSGLDDDRRAVVAYAVSTEAFGFAVADVGRGVLNSLRDNPTHAHLGSDDGALMAAVGHGASRRPDASGMGFANLIQAVADLYGQWSFRSGNARLVIDGQGNGSRNLIRHSSPDLQGFQLSVEAVPKKSTW
jgi:hypothetical protein